MKNVPPDEWLCEDVFTWMKVNGFETYANLFANHHKIDGKVLLNLTEHDLRERPLQLEVLGDIKRLSNAINLLKLQILRNASSPEQQSKSTLHHVEPCNNDGPSPQRLSPKPKHHESSNGFHHVENGGIVEIVDGGIIVNNAPDENLPHSTTSLRRTESGSDFFIHKIESEDTKTKSIIKTAMAAVYCSSVFLLTSFVMVIVHDRVPDMKTYPPLPDLVLDSIPLIPWAFEVCEMLACILGVVWCLVVLFHKHRLILLRRMFSLTGTVFMLRCVTMLITSLSVPGVHLECTSQSYGDVYAKLRQAFRIWYGMGMSLRGVRTCGDYMFSGHTTAVTLLNHFVTEYTPDGWHYLHTASWVMNLFSIFFILAGHEHYSIDVFVAFYISSRLFLYYHSMAYHARSMTSADSRTRIWFPLFWFFESGGHVGRVKNEYEVPLPSLASIQSVFSKILSIFSAFGRHEEIKPSDVSPNHHQYDHHKQKGVKFSIGGGGADKEHVKKQKTKNGKVKSS